MDEVLWTLLKVIIYISILVAGLLVYFLESLPSPRRYWMMRKIPGPEGAFYFGNGYSIKDVPVEDFLAWLEGNLRCYERVMKIWILGVSHVHLKDPQDIQALMNSKQHITKGKEYDLIQTWLDKGLLTSTGHLWTMRRKLLTPAFHFKILDDNLNIFNRNGKILSQKFMERKGQEVDIESLITLCTLDVIMSTAMGMDIKAQSNSGQEYVSHIKRISELLTYRSIRPHLYKEWIFKLSSTGKETKQTIDFLHNFSYKVINERKELLKESSIGIDEQDIAVGGKIRRAFLDTLLEVEASRPGTLSDKDMREEVDTFMFEGHDTTSVALMYIFFNLAHHPDIQDKVYEELCEIFGDSDRDATSSDLNNMCYLEKVIKESLRLYPSVPYISREIQEDLVLDGGLTVPAPSNVDITIYLLHRNEKYWPNPEKFDPERFSEEQCRGRHPYAYIPFSAGPRNCIGQRFAMMELKTVVSTVMRSLRVEPITKREDFKLMIHLVLRTNVKILCRFYPR